LARLRDQGVHLLLIEQFVRPALALSDRGYVLDNGEVVLSGDSEELLTSDTVADIYIGRAASS
jgi:branched-chain amino acid transport system ATP-binding protein